MKRDFLEGLKLDKDTIDTIMAEHGKTVEGHKTSQTALQKQLSDVQDALKKFDGVEPEKMTGEIAKLQADLQTKEADFAQQLAARDFDSLLNERIAGARGRNAKAIKSLLDAEKLRGSQNLKEDIAAALKALQESDAYLFEETKPGVQVSTGGQHSQEKPGEIDPFDAACAMYEKKK
ncbi:MAG: phage scaffolding protein [Clostridiales bacterium]|nr:phage scaffolding protein [Clostridiales bacterium]